MSRKPNSLNAVQMQGSVSREGAKIREDLNPQNREHFVQKRNENHERSQSQERVLGDGISHGSTLKSLFEFSPVWTAFYNPCKSVLFAPPPPREPKLLPLPAKISFSVPEPFVVMNVLNSPQSASISVHQRFKNVFTLPFSAIVRQLVRRSPAVRDEGESLGVGRMPLSWRLIPAFSLEGEHA